MFGLYKALYDYTPQDVENELALTEETSVLYVLDKEDDQWWKAKLKTESGDGAVGLVPSSYLEEIEPLSEARAIYAYTATNEEEMTMEEDAVLQVFEQDDEWTLVRIMGADRLGYVPASYIQTSEGTGGEGFAALEEADPPQAAYVDPSERVAAERDKAKADSIVTWVVSEVDKKKKKKGTLGVGNGAVFFASESDKNPIQQFPITTVTSASQDAKDIHLTIASLPSPLHFHASTRDDADAIISKLHTSKDLSGGSFSSSDGYAAHYDGDDNAPAPTSSPPNSKNVRWAPSPTSPVGASAAEGAEKDAVALYDFDAQGEDELSLREGEKLVVVDQNDGAKDWWKVRNASGQEGVVPAQYVELSSGHAGSDHDGEAAAAEAAAARDREDAQARAEAERAAEEDRKQRTEAEERRKRREEKARRDEEAQRRESARQEAPPEPPKIRHRPSAQDVAAARELPSAKGRSQPDRPVASSSSGRSRPAEGKTRIWHDKTGQFKVEAEFLGFKGGKLRLHKLNGVVIEVPLEKMSPEDTDYIERVTGSRRAPPNDDDIPLAQVHPQAHKSRPTSSVTRDHASAGSSRQHAPPAGRPPQKKAPRTDWFDFFLSAGCDMDDSTRYAQAFDRDRIDESILGDIETSTLRSLGLREGDVIRVRKAIAARNPPKEQRAQIESDEALARRLQEEENSGKSTTQRTSTSSPAPGLFTGAGGALKNQTRRGRPDRKGTDSSVDASALASASNKLARIETPPPKAPSPVSPPSKPVSPPKPTPAVSNGFDDDAWTPRPSSTKPATPTPPPVAIAAPIPHTPSLISPQRSGSAAPAPVVPQATGAFDYLASIGQARPPSAPVQQQQNLLQPSVTGMSSLSINSSSSTSPPQSYHNGLGFNGSNAPMGQLLQSQQTGAFQQQTARGPLAPVPSNQSLLNPLIPTNSGANQFIPTRQTASPSNFLQSQPTGYQTSHPTGFQSMQQTGFQQPQPTGYQQPQQPQQTGYQQPQQTGYQQPQQTGFPPAFGGGGYGFVAPQPTGYPNPILQSNASALSAADQFNALASARPQPSPGPAAQPNNFNPSQVFASMRKGPVAAAGPQDANKYDALRPQVTGYPMQMQPQQTGFMQPQPSGFMQQQQTGFMPQQPGGYQQYQQQPYR